MSAAGESGQWAVQGECRLGPKADIAETCIALAALGIEREEVKTTRRPGNPAMKHQRAATTRTAHDKTGLDNVKADAAENFFQGGSPKTGHPISPPGPPSAPEIVLRQISGDGVWMKI